MTKPIDSIKGKQRERNRATEKQGGRISNKQEKFMRENIDELGWEGIAAAIGKNVEAVKDFCERKGILPLRPDGEFDESALIKADLITESFWPFICEQLTDNEIPFFKEQYCSHILQFSKMGDVLFNEKMQIMHLVRNEILLDRVYKRQREFLAENEDIKQQIRNLVKINGPDTDVKIKGLKDIIQYNNSNFATFNKEASELQNKISGLRSDLNANRAQRTKDLKNVNSTFSTYIHALDQEVFQTKEGIEINIFRAAMEKERARLIQWHMYDDKEADIPLLTPEIYKLVKNRDKERLAAEDGAWPTQTGATSEDIS